MASDDDREYEEFQAQRAARRLKDAVKEGLKELIAEGELELGGGDDEGEGEGRKKKAAKKDDEEEAPKRGKGLLSDYGI